MKNDGKYHLPIAQSPEYGDDEDTVYDLSLFRWGVKTAKTVLELLDMTEPNMPKWDKVIENLVPYPVDQDGLMVGATLKMTSMHRHWSHLFPIYPLHVLILFHSLKNIFVNSFIHRKWTMKSLPN